MLVGSRLWDMKIKRGETGESRTFYRPPTFRVFPTTWEPGTGYASASSLLGLAKVVTWSTTYLAIWRPLVSRFVIDHIWDGKSLQRPQILFMAQFWQFKALGTLENKEERFGKLSSSSTFTSLKHDCVFNNGAFCCPKLCLFLGSKV